MESVGIVVVTYNRLALLKENIDSLRRQSYQNFRIIVVNNGSTDGTSEWLLLQHDLLVINQENMGGAGGFYTGLKCVAEHGYDYCWFMDDDVICNIDSLQELLNCVMLLKCEWGFLCSSVFDKNGYPTNVPEVDSRNQEGYPDWTRFLCDGIVKVRTATFVSVFISVQNIYRYGLPIKEFFIWGDDTEYTARLSNSLPCFVVGKSRVVHMREMVNGLSFLDEPKSYRLGLYYYMFRNQFYIARKGYWRKRLPILRYFYTKILLMLKAIYTFKFMHFRIIIRAVFAALFFFPAIKYPEKND